MKFSDEFECEIFGKMYGVSCTVNHYFDEEFDRDFKSVEVVKVVDELGEEIEDEDVINEAAEICLDKEFELHSTDDSYYEEVDMFFRRQA